MTLLSRYKRQLSLMLVLGVVMGVLAQQSPYFLTVPNLLTVSTHVAEVGIIACGMTLIIMTGGIDLSVGSLLGLCGIVLGYLWVPLGPVGAISAALFAGFLGGAFNGTLVVAGKLPPLVVTLGTMALFRGIAMVISKAEPFSQFPPGFRWLGQGKIEPFPGIIHAVPVQLVIWIALVLLFMLAVDRLPFGRYLAAIGDNEQAARFAALPVNTVKYVAYSGTGLLAALAAVIFTSRVSTAKADAGMNFELEAITAVVLGGTAITGGRGTILGTFLGVLILGFMRNGLNLAKVPSIYQTMLAGTLLIIVSIANERLLERSMRRRPGKAEALPAPGEGTAA